MVSKFFMTVVTKLVSVTCASSLRRRLTTLQTKNFVRTVLLIAGSATCSFCPACQSYLHRQSCLLVTGIPFIFFTVSSSLDAIFPCFIENKPNTDNLSCYWITPGQYSSGWNSPLSSSWLWKSRPVGEHTFVLHAIVMGKQRFCNWKPEPKGAWA